MSDHELTVGRGVIAELVGLAALEVPGIVRIGRGGSAWRRYLGGPSVAVRFEGERVRVRCGSGPARVARSHRAGRHGRRRDRRTAADRVMEVTVLVDVGN
jgi:hypothetical protein